MAVVMSPKNAVTAAREILNGPRAEEAERLETIRLALRPDTGPSVELPKNPLPVMANLARKSRTNFLPLVVKNFSQVMKVDGFTPSVDDGGRGWTYWQRNRFDALQTGVNRSALSYGSSYVSALPGTDGPAWTPRSALTMTALYADPTVDEWPLMALDVDDRMLKLYDEEAVYYIGNENAPRSPGGFTLNGTSGYSSAPDFRFIEARPHGVGVCPIVRFRDRMLLDGEEQYGIVEPLLSIQQRIDETVFGMLISQFYAAFKQRYVIGWTPQDELEALEASASSLWTFDSEKVKVGELSETDLTRYIDAKNSAKLDMAAIAQLSPAALGQQGISNVSGAVMDGLETSKDREAAEITTSFGESYEQLFRISSHIDKHDEGAADFQAEVRWMSTVDMSIAQATDALSKWVVSLGVNDKLARKWLPGWTDQMEAENEKLGPSVVADGQPDTVNAADPLDTFLASMERQAAPVNTGVSPAS